MRSSLKVILAVGVALAAIFAAAEPDTFYLGKGRDGALTISNSRTVNTYARLGAGVDAGVKQLVVAPAAGFEDMVGAPESLIMVLQTTGDGPDPAAGDQSPVGLSGSNVGRWEFARLQSPPVGQGDGGILLPLTQPLVNSYSAGLTQVVAVPEYSSLRVSLDGSIVAEPWDGGTGGVIAFLVQNTLLNDGVINATGVGFRGGDAVASSGSGNGLVCFLNADSDGKSGRKGEGIVWSAYNNNGWRNRSNGGGAGVCVQAGGGGGGNGGLGGQGGNAQGGEDAGGQGGAPLNYSLLDRLTFGGGGGSGHTGSDVNGRGGNGGGLIYIRAGSLMGTTGRIVASGQAGGSSTEGAGGGGAGGSIVVRIASSAECQSIAAMGGWGGNNSTTSEVRAPGGGGGGGRVFFQASENTGCSIYVDAGVAGTTPDGSYFGATPVASGAGSYVGAVDVMNTTGFNPPGGSTVSEPVHLSYTNNPTPIIKGTAPQQGMRVVIYLDGGLLGRASADGGGYFEYPSPITLPNGTYRVQAATEHMGIQSAKSVYNEFTVDTVKPDTAIDAGPAVRTNSQTADFTFSSDAGDVTGYECNLDDGGFKTCSARSLFYPINEASHFLAVRAVDRAGNKDDSPASRSWTVDLTPPSAPVVSSPLNGALLDAGSLTGAGEVRIQGTVDGGVEVLLYVDNTSSNVTVPVADGGTWAILRTLGQGRHWVQAVARDDVSNLSPLSEVTAFTIDTVAPGTPLVMSPQDGGYVTTTLPLIQGKADAGSVVIVTLSGADAGQELKTVANGSSDWSVIPLTELGQGPHRLMVVAHDEALNFSPDASYTFIVDSLAPGAPTISFPVNGQYLDAGLVGVVGGAEPGSTVQLFVDDLDGGLSTVGSDGGWTISSSLSDGRHWVRARAVDSAGNVSFFSNTVVIHIDTGMNPATSVRSPDAGSYVRMDPLVLTGLGEPGSELTVTLQLADGGPQSWGGTVPNTSNQWVFEVPASLPEGLYTVTARAQDKAGNVSEHAPAAGHGFVLDRTPPDTIISSSPPLFSNSNDAGFGFTSSETEVVYKCTLDGGAFEVCPASYPGLADRTYTLLVRAEDRAGNVDLTPASYTWTVDTAKPVVSINGPATVTTESIALFKFDAGEPEVSYQCMRGDAGFSDCSNPHLIEGLDQGSYVLTVHATDRAQNVSDSAEWRWTVDKGLPEPEFLSGPAEYIKSLNADFTFRLKASADAGTSMGAEFKCRLGTTGEFAPCTSPHSVSVLGEGTYKLYVRAKDNLGRETPANLYAIREWVVDQTPPDTEIKDTPPLWTNKPAGAFQFSAIEEKKHQGFQCSLNGGSFTDCTGSSSGPVSNYYTTAKLADGPYTIQVKAVDAAGNEDDSAATYSWTVDTLPPGVPTLDNPEREMLIATTTPLISGSAEPSSTVSLLVDGEPSTTVKVASDGHWQTRLSLPGSAPYTHKLQVFTSDLAGNKSDLTDEVSMTLDTQAPTATIVSGPEGRVYAQTVTFVFDSDDPDATFECSYQGAAFKACDREYTISDLTEDAYILQVKAKDRAGNLSDPQTRNWWIYLGGDSYAMGGGLGCGSAAGGASFLPLLGLMGVFLRAARRRGSRAREETERYLSRW